MYSFADVLKVIEQQTRLLDEFTIKLFNLLSIAHRNSVIYYGKADQQFDIRSQQPTRTDLGIELNKEQSLHYLRHTHEGHHVLSEYNFRKCRWNSTEKWKNDNRGVGVLWRTG